jgi:hypothetical protein
LAAENERLELDVESLVVYLTRSDVKAPEIDLRHARSVAA